MQYFVLYGVQYHNSLQDPLDVVAVSWQLLQIIAYTLTLYVNVKLLLRNSPRQGTSHSLTENSAGQLRDVFFHCQNRRQS